MFWLRRNCIIECEVFLNHSLGSICRNLSVNRDTNLALLRSERFTLIVAVAFISFPCNINERLKLFLIVLIGSVHLNVHIFLFLLERNWKYKFCLLDVSLAGHDPWYRSQTLFFWFSFLGARWKIIIHWTSMLLNK